MTIYSQQHLQEQNTEQKQETWKENVELPEALIYAACASTWPLTQRNGVHCIQQKTLWDVKVLDSTVFLQYLFFNISVLW